MLDMTKEIEREQGETPKVDFEIQVPAEVLAKSEDSDFEDTVWNLLQDLQDLEELER